MEYKIENKPKSKKEIEVTLSPEDVEKYTEKAVQNLSAEMKIPGFRPGKAPVAMVKDMLGKEKIWQESCYEAINSSYLEIIKKEKMDVISAPEVNVAKTEPNKPLSYRASVSIFPVINLSDYKGTAKNILKEKKKIQVETKEVEDTIESIRKARLDTIKEEDQPKTDDDFAKSLGDFSDMEDLKKKIKDNIQIEKENKETERIRIKTIEVIGEESFLEIPDVLIEKQAESMFKNFKNMNAQIFEEYLKKSGKTEEGIKEELKKQAEKRILFSLILQKIAEKENIKISDEEEEREVKAYLANIKNDDEKKRIEMDKLKIYIREAMQNKKVFETLESF